MSDAAETTSHSFAYRDPLWGWMSGGLDYASREHCVRAAMRHAAATGHPVRLKTTTSLSTYEDLPPPA